MDTSRHGAVSKAWLLGLTGTLALSMLLHVALPRGVHAAGIRIMDQSASAAGQGSAFTAQADDPSAVYYNPAGMVQLRGVQFSLGTLLAGGSTEFRNAAGTTVTGNFDGSVAFPPPSHVYITANLGDVGLSGMDNVTAGIGVLSPFGTLYRYPNSGPFSNTVTFEALELIDIKPTLAYRFNDQLSVGIGADIYSFFDWWGEGQYQYQATADAGLSFALTGNPTPTPIELNGEDTAPGFNVSLLYTPFRNSDGKPLVNVGLVYRSQATMHLDGELLVNGTKAADSSITIVIPQVITGAIALWPVRDQEREWKFEMDVDYTGWKSVRNTDIRLSTGPPLSPVSFPRDWESGFTVMFGTEHKWLRPSLLPDWEVALRGGYYFSQAAVPDATFIPTVPDADQHSISFGTGFLCKGQGRFFGWIPCGGTEGKWYQPKGIGLDFAYKALIYEDRNVSGSTNPLSVTSPPNQIDGNYETTFHMGLITMRLMF